MKKLVSMLMAFVLLFGLSGLSEAKSSIKGSFSGGSKPSISSGSTYKSSSNSSTGSTNVYSSGQKSPSSNVTQKPSYQQPQPRTSLFGGGIGHFLGGMATGALMGSLLSHMFHPFGGFGQGFSVGGVIFDGILLFLGYKLIRRLFFR